VDANLFRRGYYPAGEGQIKVSVNSKHTIDEPLPAILLTGHENLLQVRGVSHSSLDLESARVAERQSETASLHLKNLGCPVNIANEYSNSDSTGSGITLWAVFGNEELDFENPMILGADALGERGKKAEDLGKFAAEKLISLIESGACVGEYLCDQLIPYLGVVGGSLKTSRVTNHAISNIRLAELFLDVKFDVGENYVSCSKATPE
jgi:RNA 3'-terminal phosphate cyclase (ATP)/RNA 3'-terminal phosphate cyclase (GTP)